MKCEKAKSYLDEYFDGTLTEDLSEKIMTHLAACEKCNTEYKLLSNFLQQTSNLRTGVKPPEDILDRITEQLMKIPSKTETDKNKLCKTEVQKIESVLKKEMKKRKKEPAKAKKNVRKSEKGFSVIIKKFITAVIGLIILIGGYFYYESLQNNSPWDIRLISGSYSINGIKTDAAELNEGDFLSTEDDTRLRINIPGVGFGVLNDSTSIVLVKAKNGENIVKFNSGSMQVESQDIQSGFVIQTNFASIIDLGSNFSARYIAYNEIELEVEKGEIDIVYGDENLKLIVDHVCSVYESRGIGVPYHINTTMEFKQALFAFERDKKNIFSLKTLLSIAEDYDALTLWSLLQTADKSNRGAILYELQSYFPLPANVTSAGIISLDKEMLKLYWDEIEWQLQR